MHAIISEFTVFFKRIYNTYDCDKLNILASNCYVVAATVTAEAQFISHKKMKELNFVELLLH